MRMRLRLGTVFCSLIASAYAGDGRLEIAGAMLPYTITNGGSYILTENLVVSGTNTTAITIAADNVSMDLNGFAVIGPGLNSGHGIYADSARSGVTICNGVVRNWMAIGKYGLAALGNSARIEGVTAYSNYVGIGVGDNGLIRRCVVRSCSSYGLTAGAGCAVDDCTAQACDTGIRVGDGSTVTHCSANQNTNGISVVNRAMIVDCVAGNNGSAGISLGNGSALRCSACDNGGTGIGGSVGIRVFDCVVNYNGSDGVFGQSLCHFKHNSCAGNGGAGIVSASWKSCFEGNYLYGNTVGINVEYGTGASARNNVLIGNVAVLNATNYWVSTNAVASNHFQMQTNPLASFTPNPWINISVP